MTLARLMIAVAGTELAPASARRIGEQDVAGVTLFRAHNVVDPPQIRRLTAAIQGARPAGAAPLLVAADQEGGQLVGLGDGTTQFAGAMACGATGDEALTERVKALRTAQPDAPDDSRSGAGQGGVIFAPSREAGRGGVVIRDARTGSPSA